jgi:hypothetical protein
LNTALLKKSIFNSKKAKIKLDDFKKNYLRVGGEINTKYNQIVPPVNRCKQFIFAWVPRLKMIN